MISSEDEMNFSNMIVVRATSARPFRFFQPCSRSLRALPLKAAVGWLVTE